MSATAKNCSHCHKSSLSLLLLRPSPIATHSDLQAPGSAHTEIDEALVKPFIPDGLKESRPVLRLLRAGYVHLHIPSRDTWLTWRVTDEADLLAHNHPLFATPSVSAVCCRAAHNVSGFKLLTIPDAANLMGKTIWLAFSANLWSDKLKKQNKANPKAMVAITLGATQAKAPAFTPTAQNLKRQVLECNVQHWRLPAVDAQLQPAFPFTSLCADDEIAHMAATLKKAAAGHTETKDKELAVVLPDPVGYAAELNALRLIAEKHRLQLRPSDTHKLQSHFVLEGLVNNVADVRGLNNVAPVVSRATFDLLKRSNPTRMQGATWEPLQAGSRPSPQQMGRQWTPQARQTFQDQAPKFEALARKEIESGYDRDASQKWVAALEKSTRDHLACYEQQWLTARDHAAVGQYFALHFDDEAANRPGTAQGHSPGATYIREVSWIDGPAPKTSVALLDTYMAAYAKQPDDPHAFAVRAMAANQKELFTALADQLDQLAADPNGGGMRDKSVDFIKGLLDIKGERFRVKYSWLTDLTLSFAIGPMNNLATAATTYAALGGANVFKTRPKVAALAQGAAGWLGGMDTALKSAMAQKMVRPVLIMAWVENSLVNRAIAGPGKQIDGWMGARPGGRTLVSLLTDTERLSKGPVELGDLIAAHDPGSLAHGKAAGKTLAAQASGAIVLNATSGLTPQQGAALFAQQVEEARKIGASVRAAMPTGVKAVSMSIDGRLALASVIVQSIGIINGRQAVAHAELELNKATNADRADKEKALRDAQLGYMDSMGGLAAGSLDTLRVAGEAMNLQRGAAAGTVAQTSIHVLKFGAQVAGVFGGALNAYVSLLKADEAKEKGLSASRYFHLLALSSFAGTGATALAGSALVVGEFIVDRQISSIAAQQAAKRFVATRVAGVALGTAVPVVGWILLGVGIVTTVGAALMEPTKLEAWARQTPFGKGPDGQKYKTLDEQNKTLREALGLASEPRATTVQAA